MLVWGDLVPVSSWAGMARLAQRAQQEEMQHDAQRQPE